MTEGTEPRPAAETPGSRMNHWFLLAALVALFGSAFTMITIAVETLTPFTLVAIRIVTATAVLLGVAIALGHRLPRLRTTGGKVDLRVWGMLAVLGLSGNVVPFTLISWGQQTVSSSIAGILMAIMPLTTLGLAALYVPGETITGRRLIGFGLGFVGLVVLFGPSTLGDMGGRTWPAQLAILGAACCYALNAVLTKNRPPMDPVVAGAGIHVCASAVILPLAFLLEDPAALQPSLASLAAVIVLGVLCSALATLILLRLIDEAGPTFTAQINYLIPLWAVALGFLFLGEEPGSAALIALALILSGIALAQTGRR